jgi:hypothetical protein
MEAKIPDPDIDLITHDNALRVLEKGGESDGELKTLSLFSISLSDRIRKFSKF